MVSKSFKVMIYIKHFLLIPLILDPNKKLWFSHVPYFITSVAKVYIFTGRCPWISGVHVSITMQENNYVLINL